MEEQSVVKAVGLGIGSVWGFFSTLNYTLITVLVVIQFIDILLGVLFSMYNSEFKSSSMKKGVIMKFIILLMLLLLALFQLCLTEYGIDLPIGNTAIGVVIFMETMSILETMVSREVPVPNFVMKWFKDNKEKVDNMEINGTKIEK